MWLHILVGPCWCVYLALFGSRLAILTTVTLASTSNALPDDGDDCTETCRSCFNVNFNVNFKIVFKTIHLCISW